jgi:hypothetical protein
MLIRIALVCFVCVTSGGCINAFLTRQGNGIQPLFGVKDIPPYSTVSTMSSLWSSSSCTDKSDRNSDGGGGGKSKAKAALYPFSEARKIARGHGFSSMQEFFEYDCPGAYQLPKNPNEVWSDDWKGWDDFLGTILDWEESRRVARTLNVNSEEEYLKLFQEKKLRDDDIASRLPYRPDLKYSDQWVSWDDFLRHPSE